MGNRYLKDILESGEIDEIKIARLLEIISLNLHVDVNGDDAGLHIADGQFSVGSVAKGHETVLGQGDSYPVPVGYHVEFSALSASTTLTGVDITEDLQSDSGSGVAFFGGTEVGKTLLIGSDYPTSGVKLKIITALSAGTGTAGTNFIYSASTGGVPIFEQMSYMSTNANSPYDQYGPKILNHDNSNEQVRWGISPFKKPHKLTLTINGVAIEKYWYFANITSPMITDSVIEQVKMHTSRTEINADGRLEFFDDARRKKFLIVERYDNGVSSSYNYNIRISKIMTASVKDNKFANGAIDGTILIVRIPDGLDTSVPILLDIDFYGDEGNSANNEVKFQLDINLIGDGFVFGNTSRLPDSTKIKLVAPHATAKARTTTSFHIQIMESLPGDLLAISLRRMGSNPDDTYGGDVALTGTHVSGYFWK